MVQQNVAATDAVKYARVARQFARHARDEGRKLQRRPVDAVGAALFTITVAGLMVVLTEAGEGRWRVVAVAASLGLVAAVLLAFQERRAPDPVIAVSLWRRRPIAAANATSRANGAGWPLISSSPSLPR